MGYPIANIPLGKAVLLAMPQVVPATWDEYAGFTNEDIARLVSVSPRQQALMHHLAKGDSAGTFRHTDCASNATARRVMAELIQMTHSLSQAHCMRRIVELGLLTLSDAPIKFAPVKMAKPAEMLTYALVSRGWSARQIIDNLKPENMQTVHHNIDEGFKASGIRPNQRIVRLLGAGILLSDRQLYASLM